ncbi:alpha-galactosidase [Pelagicoccus enzymogenes]|uniref:alpha-galactosidase n=1 Tax=Pelagicoccus enzymogenes TaxID=2773457 RepID=UPI00280CA75F|nr:alpha-galactosidase [Pelagicoccus enzymogenes]MDQ8200529.1 alpha-galactosidase [Pelagicoccus enzymogenes]
MKYLIILIGSWLVGATVLKAEILALPEVRIHTLDAKPGLVAESRFEATPGGGRTLTVTLHNEGDEDVRLESVETRFGWGGEPSGETLVATGGTTQFRHPTRVTEAAHWPATSASFLLRKDGDRHLLAGLLGWRKFYTELSFDAGEVSVKTFGEQKRIRPGSVVTLESIWLEESESWEGLLYRYGDQIAAANEVKLPEKEQIVGWANWDYYGKHFSGESILENGRELAKMNVGGSLVQIDDGWREHAGDFGDEDVRIGDLDAIVDEIKASGMRAGIHVDSARADPRSKIARKHPEYFLHLEDGSLLVGERSNNPPGHLYFDYTHPEARAHMAANIRWLREKGFEYFKLDFMRFAAEVNILSRAELPADTRIVRHDDSMTLFEGFNLMMIAFREAMGEDSFFLGCSAEFGVTYGHVDGLRSGGDIDPTFSRYQRSTMENGGMFFLNGRVVWSDADYLVVRNKFDEDEDRVDEVRKSGWENSWSMSRMWAHYVGLFGGPVISGDKLPTLREERRELLREAIELPKCERFYPVDFWQRGRDRDDSYHAFLGEAEDGLYLAFFNWGTTTRDYRIDGLPKGVKLSVVAGEGILNANTGEKSLTVPYSHSTILQVSGSSFDKLRKTLSVTYPERGL